MINMKKSERFAINQWLTDYPADMDYQQIIDLLSDSEGLNSNHAITPWIVVENFPGYQIAQFIDDTRMHFEAVT